MSTIKLNKSMNSFSHKPTSLWRNIMRSFIRNRTAVFGLFIIVLFTLCAIFAPLITHDINPDNKVAAHSEMDFDALKLPPSWSHLAGTDDRGRDTFTRIVYGGRVSLQVGILAMMISTVIGVTAGLAAGYFGKWIDSLIMRIIDVILAFPSLLLAILMVAILGPSLRNAMLAIGIGFIPSFARVTRANVLSIREKEYVESAKAIGASNWRIMWLSIFPNTLSPIIVQVSLGMSYAILIEASLSFLGLGIQPPTPSWGYMLTTGRELIEYCWWLSVFPGLAIFLTVIAWNFIGDGLREAMDPKQIRR